MFLLQKLKDEAGLVLEARAAALLGKLDKSDAINSDLMDLIKELKIVSVIIESIT